MVNYKIGDIFIHRYNDMEWKLIKIVKSENYPDEYILKNINFKSLEVSFFNKIFQKKGE